MAKKNDIKTIINYINIQHSYKNNNKYVIAHYVPRGRIYLSLRFYQSPKNYYALKVKSFQLKL